MFRRKRSNPEEAKQEKEKKQSKKHKFQCGNIKA